MRYLSILLLIIIFLSGCSSVKQIAKSAFEYPPERAYTHFSLGTFYSRNLAPEAAIGEFKLALKADPDSISIREALAEEYIKDNKTEEAAAVLLDLYVRTKNPDAGIALSKVYIEDGRVLKAIEMLKEIIIAHPESSAANFFLGNAFFKLDCVEEAANAFKKAAKLEPSNEATYYNLGLVLSKMADLAGAEAAYLKAVELDSEYVSAQYALGLLYQFLGKYSEAVERYAIVESLTPFDPRVYSRMGTAFSQQDKNDEALKYLLKAVELAPQEADPSYRLCLVYLHLKKYNEALVAINRALLLGANSEMLQVKGILQLESKDSEGAIKTFEILKAKDPGNVSGYLYLSFLYNKRKDTKAAAAVLEEGVSRLPENTDLKLYLGGAYLDKKDYDGAELQYRALLALKATDVRGNYFLGVCCERKKNFAEAFQRFRKVVELDPQNADALNYLGFMYADRGENLQEAHAWLKKACELEPGNGAYVDSLGWVLYKLGKNAEARIKLEEAVKLLKENGQEDSLVFEHLGDIYLKDSAIEKAKSMYALSIKTDGENENARTKLKELETPVR